MSALKRLRKIVREGRIEFSDHAVDEMDADQLTLRQVRAVLLHGALRATHDHDPRGIQYLLRGAVDREDSEVVCRFATPDLLRIITVYIIGESTSALHAPAAPCLLCASSAHLEERLITVQRRRRGQVFTFEQIAARVCDQCGHYYFSLAMVDTMERRMNALPGNST